MVFENLRFLIITWWLVDIISLTVHCRTVYVLGFQTEYKLICHENFTNSNSIIPTCIRDIDEEPFRNTFILRAKKVRCY